MRIRQLVFAAHDLQRHADLLASVLALEPPFVDPAVAEFGLHNAVFTFGDQCLEIVAPTRGTTAAGRLLDKRGDSGYMLILQTTDFDAARSRLERLGVRRVWAADLPDMRAMHLHPKDQGARSSRSTSRSRPHRGAGVGRPGACSRGAPAGSWWSA